MKDLSIIPECYVDTSLTETLIHNVEVNHQKGCGTVAKKMKENFENDFALGIIDKDKLEIDYLKEFSEISKSDNLILYKHLKKNHYFIQVVPAMEKFIIHCMGTAKMELADYDLSTDFDKFKKKAKSVNSKDDPTFKKVFRKLVKEKEPQILLLQKWLNYLRAYKHTATEDELKALNTL